MFAPAAMGAAAIAVSSPAGACPSPASAFGARGALAKTEIAGYVTVYKSDNYFYLPYAVTKKEWRRHGVGGALLSEVERLAKEEKVEYILMSVYVYNSSVHNFLRVRGYVPSKRLVQYSKTITTKGRK
ncbi:MAG: hypothetical protein B7Z63_06825 [Ignavibacteriae bacterium 37-53-5]|nr:MAG: hypothetical protein B7Z63_06825 [Ignavibacteriae bacterium 37-53-5]